MYHHSQLMYHHGQHGGTSTKILSLQTLSVACPTCSTHFSQHFAHYLIITLLSSPKPINPRTTPTSWITTEIFSLKSARRRLERTYIASHSIFYLKLLRSANNRYHKFIAAAKKSFYASLVQSSSKPRALWKTINSIVHRTANRSLPTSSPQAALPQLFATHFSDKLKDSFQPTNQPLLPSFFYATFTPSSTPLFHSCHLTRNRQFTLSII